MNVLTKVDVFEISVVTVPANQNAVATEVKSTEDIFPNAFEIKAGRRNRKADEDLINETIAQLNSCISALNSLLDDGAENKPTEDDGEKEKAVPEVNTVETVKEPKENDNSKRANAILEKLKEMEN